MLYHNFFRWLFRLNRRDCEHDFEYAGYSFTNIGYGEAFRMKHYKCKNCCQKEKRHDSDAGTFIYY